MLDRWSRYADGPKLCFADGPKLSLWEEEEARRVRNGFVVTLPKGASQLSYNCNAFILDTDREEIDKGAKAVPDKNLKINFNCLLLPML